MSVVSGRTFNQSPSSVKAMAQDGPVFVTDRGRPTIVVLSVDEYERLTGSGNVRDSLMMEGDADLFEPVVLRRNVSDFEPMGVEVVNPWDRLD